MTETTNDRLLFMDAKRFDELLAADGYDPDPRSSFTGSGLLFTYNEPTEDQMRRAAVRLVQEKRAVVMRTEPTP